MPEIGKFASLFPGGSYNYKKINKLNSKTFQIPIFSNVFLDYKVTGEFSQFLSKVEIKEYEFKTIRKGIFKNNKDDNEEHWFANFYFSKIPKTGELKVWFK